MSPLAAIPRATPTALLSLGAALAAALIVIAAIGMACGDTSNQPDTGDESDGAT